MIATLVTMLLVQAVPSKPADTPVAAAAPADWQALPELRLRRHPAAGDIASNYVEGEARAGRCAAARQVGGLWAIRVDFALLVSDSGTLRRIVPHAIGCATVEQYATGLLERLARDNVDPPGADGWWHTALDFTWRN